MKINVGDAGFKVAPLPGAPSVAPSAAIVEGVPQLGAAGLRIGNEMAQNDAMDAHLNYLEAHRQRQEAQVVAKEAKRAEAMTIHARAQNALADAHDQLAAGIQDGTVSTDLAPKLWSDASQKIVDEHLKTVDRANVELVRAGLVNNVGSLGRSINGEVLKRNRHEIGSKLSDYLEEMQRYAGSDFEGAKKQGVMAIEAQAPLAGYNAEQVQKMRQGFIEGITFNTASSHLNNAMNDMGALREFVKTLPNAKDLDPGKKNILEGKALHFITTLENKALAAENRRLTQLQRVGNQLEQRIAMGVPIQDQDLAGYQQAAKGTAFEEFANGLADEQKTVSEMLKKTPTEQAAFVGALEQKLMTTGEGNPRLVNRLRQTVNSTIKLLHDNPLQYAMDRAGAQVEPLDLAKPDSWSENLANRAQVLSAQQRQVGGGMGALFPQEAAALAHVLATGTPEQKKSYLEPLRRGLNDDAVFRSTIQQVAKDSPVTALAAVIATKEAPLTTGSAWWRESWQPGDTSSLMLKGEQLLNPSKGQKAEDGRTKGFPMPKESDEKVMRTRFSDAVGEVFAGAPQAYDAQLQAARAVYAGLSADKGDFSGELDSKRWAEAMNRTMPIGKFNGSPILKPWGMDDDVFKDRIANAFPQALKAAGLPAEMAGATGRYTLQNLTGTRYLVRQGTDYLTGPKGRVVIDVPEVPSTYLSPAERTARWIPQ